MQHALQSLKGTEIQTQLQQTIQGDCSCGITFKIQVANCIPHYSCECGSGFLYSWCLRKLCEEGRFPRNHCKQCQYCTQQFPCTRCTTPVQTPGAEEEEVIDSDEL